MPSTAWTSRPSIVNWMIFCSGRGIAGLWSVDRERPRVLVRHSERNHIVERPTPGALTCGFDLGLELVSELGDHRPDRHRHRVAKHAQAVADDLLLDGGHDVE